jgi:hypothetical protein
VTDEMARAERELVEVVRRRVERGLLILEVDATRRPDLAEWLRANAGTQPVPTSAGWAPADPGGVLVCWFAPRLGLEARFWLRLPVGPNLRRIVAEGRVGFALPGGRPVFVPVKTDRAAEALAGSS